MIVLYKDLSDRALTILTAIMCAISALIVLMSFISLGLTGSNLTIWQEIETPSYLDYIRSSERCTDLYT